MRVATKNKIDYRTVINDLLGYADEKDKHDMGSMRLYLTRMIQQS